MKPLILEFAEEPNITDIDYSLVEYSELQHLSVVKDTNIAAIKTVSMETETFTKTVGEPSDSDNDLRSNLKRLLDTGTETLSGTEPSDSDDNYSMMKVLMDTQTITESVEPTDADK
jgi:hypothetical protein